MIKRILVIITFLPMIIVCWLLLFVGVFGYLFFNKSVDHYADYVFNIYADWAEK